MSDQAPFTIKVFIHKGDVMVVFNQPYEFLHFSPALAREVANHLIAKADEIDPPAVPKLTVLQ